MKKPLLLACLMALSPLRALAAIVTYSTTGSEICIASAGCDVASQTIGGGVTITYLPVASFSVNANPTSLGDFGQITVSCVSGGTGCGNQSLAGLNLFINITQTGPSPGNASMPAGVIAGSISGTASSATINWSVLNTQNIGAINYSVFLNPLGLVPPGVNAGVTDVRAMITAVFVIRPSRALGLRGSGSMRRVVSSCH